MDIFSKPDTWIALLTLTALEIMLGIDNTVFISILTRKLPKQDQPRARQIALGVAMGMRILLLLSIGWVIGLTEPLFHLQKDDCGQRSACRTSVFDPAPSPHWQLDNRLSPA